MRMRFGLAVLVTALAPTMASGQTLGKIDFSGSSRIGTSFVSSFLRSTSPFIVNAYAGAPYSAKFNIDVPDPDPAFRLPAHGTGTAFGPAVDILCVDFLHTAKTGIYDVWFTNLGMGWPGGDDSLLYTRGKSRTIYRQIAWLANEMEDELFDTAGKQNRIDIAVAIWHILTGEPIAGRVGTTGDWSYNFATYMAQAQMASNYTTVNLREWVVVTDACVGAHEEDQYEAPGCGQEFLVHTRDTWDTVPEPGTMILFGTGLLAMAGMGLVGRSGLS